MYIYIYIEREREIGSRLHAQVPELGLSRRRLSHSSAIVPALETFASSLLTLALVIGADHIHAMTRIVSASLHVEILYLIGSGLPGGLLAGERGREREGEGRAVQLERERETERERERNHESIYIYIHIYIYIYIYNTYISYICVYIYVYIYIYIYMRLGALARRRRAWSTRGSRSRSSRRGPRRYVE